MYWEISGVEVPPEDEVGAMGVICRRRHDRWRAVRRGAALLSAVALIAALAGCEAMQRGEAQPQAMAPAATQAPAPAAQQPSGGLADLQPVPDQNSSALQEPEFYQGTGVRARPVPVADVAVKSDGMVTLNFANAEIREVVDAVLGQTLGLSYIIDPRVQGQVTARTSRPIARASVLAALENILAMNGAAMSYDNGVYKIVPLGDAGATLSTPLVGSYERDVARGYAVHILPLRYAAANEVGEILKPFVPPGRVLRVDPARNLLIFAGTGPEARDLMSMIEIFDVDWMAGMSFALFPVQVADAKSLVAELETVFMQDDNGPLAGVVRFVPIERLNAILAISPQQAYLKRAGLWIERLDRGAEGAGRSIFVYRVENGRAADLAEVLNGLFGGGTLAAPRPEVAPRLTPTTISGTPRPGAAAGAEAGGEAAAGQAGETGGGAPQLAQSTARAATAGATAARAATGTVGASIATIGNGSDIRIVADDKNNALVIMATAAEYRMIEATLKRLDVTPLQVLIEVTIAEVKLNDDLKYGLQWFFNQDNHSWTFSTLDTGAVSSAFPGFSYVFSAANSQVILNALAEITDMRVVSSPQLMVLDNQSARLQVGDQVPIATQSAVSVTNPDAPIVNSIQFRDTGVILEVTPRVNAGGLVSLDVHQEVSTVGQTTTSALNSPTIQQRSIETTVAVQSGDTIALGGLIQDQDDHSTSGLPFLSDIPILGNLFKTTNDGKQRTELLVLITPRAVRDRGEARAVTEELNRRMSAVQPLLQKIKAPTMPNPPPAKPEQTSE